MPTLRADAPLIARAVGERLRGLRVNRGMTQVEVADYLRCTPQAVSKHEKGLNQVPVDVAVKLADLYGTTCDFILRGLRDQESRDAA